MLNRRQFITKSAIGSSGAIGVSGRFVSEKRQPDYHKIDKAAAQPVLRRSLFKNPIPIKSLQLLRYGENFICSVISEDGHQGYAISNNMQMKSLYPIFINRLMPFFIGKDARDLEALIDEVYVYQSNYKLQNLALFVPLATIEFAILDLLGKIVEQPVGHLIGRVNNKTVSVYRANNHRGKSAVESIALIEQSVTNSQAKALKFKIGGRMSQNRDYPPGRTEKLIPLIRKTFGDDMTIYADSNGSYDIEEAVRIGKILEDNAVDFYEEPVPFDWYEETRAVSEKLNIPVAGGEQEASLRNFRWLIAHDALQIVQPDIFYFGGMIRSTRVARMADTKNLPCTPHISGSGLGYLYMLHFVSTLTNAGPFHEFKGVNEDIPFICPTSSLMPIEGEVNVPTGPGLGIQIDPDFLRKHKPVII